MKKAHTLIAILFTLGSIACGGTEEDFAYDEAYARTSEERALQMCIEVGREADAGTLDYTALPDTEELSCTVSQGVMKCVSNSYWVCPSGWDACTPPPGGGTCCQKKVHLEGDIGYTSGG